MAKMWEGRTSGVVNAAADDFNSSIRFDKRMIREDITGSMAHAAMLGATKIISDDDAKALIDGLAGILEDIESGALAIDDKAEDVHMFVEEVLTARCGDVGKKLHTARSRNDQVALDLRLYLRKVAEEVREALVALTGTVVEKAELYRTAIVPGYTHLQRAQPITFGHHLMAYAFMFLRDLDRLADWARRSDVCPIGSCALAGTTYPTDRQKEAHDLGFSAVSENSLDGVSDRDFAIELLGIFSILMMHLSRFSEEIVLWTSLEFHYVELSDDFTTGSSIMPQKKNSDMAELVRGKCGRVYGDLVALLTVMKGLPLAYNKDMQEDKESVFDACDTVLACLGVFGGMLSSMTAHTDVMRRAAARGFIGATDLADYLVGKGLPFRTAYKISGGVVAKCIEKNTTLEELPLDDYKTFSPLIDEGVYDAVDLDNCVKRRTSEGGTSPDCVTVEIEKAKQKLTKYKK